MKFSILSAFLFCAGGSDALGLRMDTPSSTDNNPEEAILLESAGQLKLEIEKLEEVTELLYEHMQEKLWDHLDAAFEAARFASSAENFTSSKDLAMYVSRHGKNVRDLAAQAWFYVLESRIQTSEHVFKHLYSTSGAEYSQGLRTLGQLGIRQWQHCYCLSLTTVRLDERTQKPPMWARKYWEGSWESIVPNCKEESEAVAPKEIFQAAERLRVATQGWEHDGYLQLRYTGANSNIFESDSFEYLGKGNDAKAFSLPAAKKGDVSKALFGGNVPETALASDKDWVLLLHYKSDFCRDIGPKAFVREDLIAFGCQQRDDGDYLKTPISQWEMNGPAGERLWSVVNRPIGFFELPGTLYTITVLERAGDMTKIKWTPRSQEQTMLYQIDITLGFREMWTRGLWHADAHGDNVMVTLDKTTQSLKCATFIDIGGMQVLGSNESNTAMKVLGNGRELEMEQVFEKTMSRLAHIDQLVEVYNYPLQRALLEKQELEKKKKLLEKQLLDKQELETKKLLEKQELEKKQLLNKQELEKKKLLDKQELEKQSLEKQELEKKKLLDKQLLEKQKLEKQELEKQKLEEVTRQKVKNDAKQQYGKAVDNILRNVFGHSKALSDGDVHGAIEDGLGEAYEAISPVAERSSLKLMEKFLDDQYILNFEDGVYVNIFSAENLSRTISSLKNETKNNSESLDSPVKKILLAMGEKGEEKRDLAEDIWEVLQGQIVPSHSSNPEEIYTNIASLLAGHYLVESNPEGVFTKRVRSVLKKATDAARNFELSPEVEAICAEQDRARLPGFEHCREQEFRFQTVQEFRLEEDATKLLTSRNYPQMGWLLAKMTHSDSGEGADTDFMTDCGEAFDSIEFIAGLESRPKVNVTRRVLALYDPVSLLQDANYMVVFFDENE